MVFGQVDFVRGHWSPVASLGSWKLWRAQAGLKFAGSTGPDWTGLANVDPVISGRQAVTGHPCSTNTEMHARQSWSTFMGHANLIDPIHTYPYMMLNIKFHLKC